MKKNLILLLTGWFLFSCGDEAGQNAIDSGWMLFGAGDYQAAYDMFVQAVPSTPSEAYSGLGWVALKLHRDSIHAADSYFSQATALNAMATDAYAGWSVVAWARNEHASCVARSQIVMNQDASWRLFDTTIDIQDIKLHKAFGHFRLGQYSDCISLIQQLDASWTAPSITAPNIDEMLLNKLELLYSDLE